MNAKRRALFEAETTVTRTQVPVTQFRGVGANMKENTVDPVYIITKNMMMVKSAIDVKMNTMNTILIAFIVNASQTIQMTTLMFVLRTVANARVRKTMAIELVMNVKMGTLVILIATCRKSSLL